LTLPILSNNFDKLDVLLKQREDINILGDGNCSVYAIISQLYPQTYGGYRLSSDGKLYEEMNRTITQYKNVQAKVNEIRNVAKTELYKKKLQNMQNIIIIYLMILIIW
jgi:hypothetical protein